MKGHVARRPVRTTGDGVPRYVDVRRSIESRILSGALKPGDRIPSEAELIEEYGLSRMTVNKALSALAAAGLVVRRRGSGSFVASPASQETILEIHDIQAEVQSAGHRYRHEVLRRAARRATVEDRARLGIAGPGKVLAVGVRHFADERPFVVEDRIINLAAVPEALSALFDEVPPGTWLLKRIPWTEAEHRIRAVAASKEIAALLDVPADAPCLVIERATWRSGAPVTSVHLTYPGDRHLLTARFNPARREKGSGPFST
jgi:GntR family histidine utilization transcriptional repressor